jgi:hypothetical protein
MVRSTPVPELMHGFLSRAIRPAKDMDGSPVVRLSKGEHDVQQNFTV